MEIPPGKLLFDILKQLEYIYCVTSVTYNKDRSENNPVSEGRTVINSGSLAQLVWHQLTVTLQPPLIISFLSLWNNQEAHQSSRLLFSVILFTHSSKYHRAKLAACSVRLKAMWLMKQIHSDTQELEYSHTAQIIIHTPCNYT